MIAKQNDREDSVNYRDIAARWTPHLATMGWTPVSNYFLANYHRLKISSIEAMVVIHLISYKWSAAAPYPSLAKIAKKMGLTTTSVRSHVRNLEKRRLVVRESKSGSTNRFHFDGLFEQLESLLRADERELASADHDYDIDDLRRYVRNRVSQKDGRE